MADKELKGRAKVMAARVRGLTNTPETKKAEPKKSQPVKSKPATQSLQSVVQSWLDNGLKAVSPAEKRKLFDAAWPEIEGMGLSAETVLSNKQVIDLQKLLGKYGTNYLFKRPTQSAQSSVVQSTAARPTAARPTAARQNLTFNDMLKDLGLTGKESADSAALKKVQDWLKVRPGYKAGAKTNAYLKQLSERPTSPVATTSVRPIEPTTSARPIEPTNIAQVAGYTGAAKQRQAIKSGKTRKPKNWQADEGSGWIDMHGERHNYTKDYDPKGVWAKQHNTDVSDIAKIVSSGR